MKKSKVQLFTGILFILIALIITFTDLIDVTTETSGLTSFILLVAGIVLINKGNFNIKIEKYNQLSFNERCEQLSAGLIAGNRSWFLNQSINEGMYLAVPLSYLNMDEMGGGYHRPTTVDEIQKLISENKIDNIALVKTTLSYC